MMKAAEFLHQKAKMALLDDIVSVDHDSLTLTATVTIGLETMFCEGDGVPSYVGIEYMAQSIAAFSNIPKPGATPKKVSFGLLLGSRKYVCHHPKFLVGSTVYITVEQLYYDNSIASFSGAISVDDTCYCEAQLMVYHPPSVDDFLAERGLI